MGRIVGDSDTYPLEVLVYLARPETEDDVPLGSLHFDAPSISTIAKVFDTKSGALTGWAYKSGLEGCQALAADGQDISGWEYSHLYERLKLRGFTPYTKREKAKKRGNEAHEVLEDLASGEAWDTVVKRVNKIEGEARGYAAGVLAFWEDQHGIIEPLMVETPIAGLYPRPFAGTLDLYAIRTCDPQDEEPHKFRLSDLKTSKDVYEDHAIQLDGYASALKQARPELPDPEEHSVILAKPDGTYREFFMPSVPSAWRAALEGWYARNELDFEFKAAKEGQKT